MYTEQPLEALELINKQVTNGVTGFTGHVIGIYVDQFGKTQAHVENDKGDSLYVDVRNVVLGGPPTT